MYCVKCFPWLMESAEGIFPFVKFHCGPPCPSHKCPGHQPDYLSYSAGEEQGPRRPHVYNVMPGRQGDRIVSLYCENYSFEEELG